MVGIWNDSPGDVKVNIFSSLVLHDEVLYDFASLKKILRSNSRKLKVRKNNKYHT